MASAMGHNASFDPYNQPITLIMPDGVTRSVTNINRVLYLQQLATVSGIVFGAQIGMVTILLIILALLTKPDKRRSSVFIFNTIALVCILIRTILMCLELTSPLYNFYNWITADYTHVAHALSVSAAAEVFDMISIVAIELSMMFQVRIVCCTLKQIWRRLIAAASILVVMGVVSLRFVTMVVNVDWNIIHVANETEHQLNKVDKLASASNIIIMSSIIFFSVIFCAKLLHAIFERRKLGLKQFGPMQIIFVMGCQTLVIPAIFGILAYCVLKSAQINTFMPVIVATFLPLSSMWASANTNNPNIAAPNRRQGHGNIPLGRSEYDASVGYTSDKQQPASTINTADTLTNDEGTDSLKALTPNKKSNNTTVSCDYTDLEMQRIDQIQVNRSYSVRCD